MRHILRSSALIAGHLGLEALRKVVSRSRLLVGGDRARRLRELNISSGSKTWRCLEGWRGKLRGRCLIAAHLRLEA